MYISQTHFGFTIFGSNKHSLWMKALWNCKFWSGTPCIFTYFKLNCMTKMVTFLRGQHRICVPIPLFIHQPSSIMIDVGRKVEKRMMLDRKRQQAISSISVNLRIDERSISAGLLIWSKSDRHKWGGFMLTH